MALNKSTGNMYAFVSHTYNPLKGECEHSCAYCFMRRKLLLPPLRLELKELKVNLGEGNFIFVGMFHVQFNVVGHEVLRCAQAHPEEYKSLLVRVAGYSAYFVELSREVQDDILSRTAHAL